MTAEVAEEPRPAQAEDAHIEEPSGCAVASIVARAMDDFLSATRDLQCMPTDVNRTTASKVGRKGGKKRAAAKAAKSFEGDFEEFATAADVRILLRCHC